jgi:hypothetical protein
MIELTRRCAIDGDIGTVWATKGTAKALLMPNSYTARTLSIELRSRFTTRCAWLLPVV